MLVAEFRQLIVTQQVKVHAVNHHLSPIRLVQGADNMQQGRFASSGRTDNRHHFVVFYRQRDLFQDLKAAIGFFDFFDFDHII